MKKIDVKSLLIGLLLGICFLMVAGYSNVINKGNGRYQVSAAHGGNASMEGYVVDSTTGDVWYLYNDRKSMVYIGAPRK